MSAAIQPCRDLEASSPRLTALPLTSAERFAVANSKQLEQLALQRRVDQKFLLSSAHAARLLDELAPHYTVVLAGEERFALYDTVYYDTADLLCFHDHRRRRKPRFKVRVRRYADRALTVLEVKEKTPRGDTKKQRWDHPHALEELSNTEQALLSEHFPRIASYGPLQSQARTVFRRLTLLSKHSVERVTLDFQLSITHQHQERALDALLIVETKSVGRGPQSPLVSALHALHARPLSFSKYCVTVALLGNHRVNTFLPSLRALHGVSGNERTLA